MSDRKPLVVNPSAPFAVSEMPAGDTLPASVGGLGADASGWASGKFAQFDGAKFVPGDAGGLPSGGAKSQLLVHGTSGAEWGGVFPVETGGGPYRGVYDPQATYATGDVVSYTGIDEYGVLDARFFVALSGGTLPDPFGSIGVSWDSASPTSFGRVILGDGASGTRGDVAIGTGACAYFPPPEGPFVPTGGAGVAVGYLTSLKGSLSTAVGAASYADESTVVGGGASAEAYAVAIGAFSAASTNAVAIGTFSFAVEGGVTIGSGVASTGPYNTVVGYGVYMDDAGEASTLIGAGIYASNMDANIVVGAYAGINAATCIAIGVGTTVWHDRACIIGSRGLDMPYTPQTTATRRMTVDYQDLEVDDQELNGQTGVILRDEVGGQWRITVDSSGVISAAAVI